MIAHQHPRGAFIIELMLYVGVLSVLLTAVGATFLRTAAVQRLARAQLVASERAGRILDRLRTEAESARSARVVGATNLVLTDGRGRSRLFRLAGSRLELTTGVGAAVATEVVACRVAGWTISQRADGLLYVRVDCAVLPGFADTAADTLLRVGGPWGRR